ncbi:parkin co-regulated protein-domain-containing protein [Chytriomyces sp. MP71]|nr:parkin co-regulated protein-domain-containing protein [Chytriomyces sp. MP71]
MFSTAPRTVNSTPRSKPTTGTISTPRATSKPSSSNASSFKSSAATAAETKLKSPISKPTTGTIASRAPSSNAYQTTKPVAPAAEPKLKLPSTKISNRAEPRAILDLGNGGHRTAFAAAYSKGGFPCRLEHGSVKHKIFWGQPVETVAYNPLLVTLFDGLRETEHPFLFLVPNALREMLLAYKAREKVEPLIASAIPSLRHALGSKHKSTVLSSLETVKHLATCLATSLLPYLPALLPPIALHSHSRDAQIKDAVITCLQGVESAIAFGQSEKEVEVSAGKEKKVVQVGEWIGVGGGDRGVGGADGAEALRIIKSKIPTYSSVFG